AMNDPSTWSPLEGEHSNTTLPVVKLAVSMSTDGFNPFPGAKRTVWPIVFSVLNLPETIRMKHQMLIVSAVLPGPNKVQDFQPYLHVIVDELEMLYRQGILVFD